MLDACSSLQSVPEALDLHHRIIDSVIGTQCCYCLIAHL